MQEGFLVQVLYVLVGIVSGFLNTVAGGGTLISLPVLIFMGMPGTVANATIRVAILTQNIFAIGGFHSKGLKLPYPYVIWVALVSLAGGWIGAQLALGLPEEMFRKILAVIMVVVVISIVLDRKKSGIAVEERMSLMRQVISIVGFFLLGIYGGFIQAGIGFLVIALVSNVHHISLVRTNYIKVFAAVLYTGTAVLAFALEGKIVWSTGLVIAIGHAIGAWFGSRWSVQAGDIWIKRLLVVAVAVLVVRLWWPG